MDIEWLLREYYQGCNYYYSSVNDEEELEDCCKCVKWDNSYASIKGDKKLDSCGKLTFSYSDDEDEQLCYCSKCGLSYREFSYHDMELVYCFECEKRIDGICVVDDDNDFYHLSCHWVSSKMGSFLLHFSRRHDDLIFKEELKNKGKEDAVCLMCEEPIVGAGYQCSARECQFLLHQSCLELPLKMQHPYHPEHTLSLSLPRQRYTYCDACGKDCTGCFSYECSECKICLDITCFRGPTSARVTAANRGPL